MFDKVVIVDCRGHLLGRLASVVAKEILTGQRVVLVRCEEVEVSGSLYRNKLKYAEYRRKKTNTNPAHGPFHHRAPARMVHHAVRGMVPHKTPRGGAAMERLKCFEGVPAPYDKMKRKVVPAALRVTRLNVGRNFCNLGRLATEVGWKHGAAVKQLEAKRKARDEAYAAEKRKAAKAKAAAKEAALGKLGEGKDTLAQFGYL